MNQECEFKCVLCDKKENHDPVKRFIPIGWHNRNIDGKPYLLCGHCGNEAHFSGGLSPSIKQSFKEKLGIDIDD